MNERELAQTLSNAAVGMAPQRDPRRLQAGMARLDRVRRIRAAGVASVVGAIAALGVFAAVPRDAATPADVRNQPTESPESGLPDLEPVLIDDAMTDTSSTTLPALTNDPAHLRTGAPIAITPPLIVATTSLPPVSTSAPPPPPTSAPPTTTTTAPSEFTASALYGSCEEDPPYDEYRGTATPGATVMITSPWSSASSVVAAGDGSWFLRVEFPSAPVGVPFTVTAGDGTTTVGLGFVRTA